MITEYQMRYINAYEIDTISVSEKKERCNFFKWYTGVIRKEMQLIIL